MIEGQEGVTWAHWRELARVCEESGIRTMFRSDHYSNLDGQHPERGSLDAWATINALAAVTSTLRLGTLVSPVTFRHPCELARLVVTADHISNGRIELGLGAGWHEREHSAHGFPFPDTKSRMNMLEEQFEIVLGNWRDGMCSFAGQHYSVEALDAQPKPVQRPHPPLIMGGNAGPRSARLAARYADEYNTNFPTAAQVRKRRARIASACQERGRDPIPFSIMTAVIVARNERELRDRIVRVAQFRNADAERLLANPPEQWVIGTLERAAEHLHRLEDAGVSRIMCQHVAFDDYEHVALLGRELAPLVA